ncbi:MAG: serine/threonine protein kinase [Acetatifactor sp.]|nr:serine/threonine protein kinase [Acetatifactor sp.]
MLEIGSVVDGKYKILSKIGQGGMSVVYMAINERANKTWAIKEVRKDGVQNFEVVKQGLIVETDMLKRLHHPNIPSIIDVVEDDERFLIVMDYIEGNSLQKALKDYGAQPQEEVIEWTKQLCDALGYLHSRRPPIIYRDMKPANVMLKPDGTVSLIDFGTAREYKVGSTGDTSVLGTKGYAAPEQYGGQGQTDARTDIYCLGATMHHLLTGQDPCRPPYTRYPIRQYDPSLSSGLEEIIIKCTNDNPNERYQSCAELMYALEHYNELDWEYKRKQNLRLGGFFAAAVLSVASFAAAITFHMLADKTQEDSYNVYLADARGSAAQEEQIRYCRDAIELDPTKADAYMYLLDDVLLADGVLSSREDETLRSILIGTDSRRTNEAAFKTNIANYDEFAYRLGLDYYYNYEDNGSKSQATKWLDIAANSTTLDNAKIERARRLGKIAAYYARIGRENKAGDAEISYLNYWTDLTELTEGDLAAVDNVTTALTMYKELAYQIDSYAEKFKAAGVPGDAMTMQLDNIEQQIAGPAFQNATQRVAELKLQLQALIERARHTVEITYRGGVGQ